MDEVKIIKALLWSTLVFGGFIALDHYFLEDTFDVWKLAFIPMGKEILSLGYKYAHILRKKNTKEFVVLKQFVYQAHDFTWIIVAFGFVAYLRIDVIYYLIPVALLNLLLVYLVKRNQHYYFGEWDLQNLSEWNKHIDIFFILDIELQNNRLKIVYVEDENDKNDPKEYKHFIIHKDQLKSPQSWYEFEKIITEFETSLKLLNKEYQKKNATLDSTYESVP